MKSRRVLPLAVMVLVAWSLGSTVGVDPTGAAEEPTPVSTCGTALIAIPGADQVLPVDVARGTTGTPISIPGADVVSISPDARTAYVVADHAVVPWWTLQKVNLVTGAVGDPVPLEFLPEGHGIGNIVVSPDGGTLYLSSFDQLAEIDAGTLALRRLIDYPPSSMRGLIVFVPRTNTVFAASGDGSTVLPVDMGTGVVGPPIVTGAWPSAISATPDGATVYTGNQLAKSLSQIDTSTSSSSLDVPLGFGPEYLAVAPDGVSAIAANRTQLARVDLRSGAVSGPIPLGTATSGMVVMPDGHTTFVIDEFPPSAYAIDADTGAKGPAVALSAIPSSIAAITPAQAPTARFTSAEAPSGRPTTFDGGPSSATCGAIATYRWDFGDGTSAVTSTTSSVEHTFVSAGSYDVKLTVTDSAGTSTTQAFTGQAMLRNGGPQAATVQEVTIAPAAVVVTPRFTG